MSLGNDFDSNRFNAYQVMWLFVFFDLPVLTQKERKLASGFRKHLLKFGFTMMQFSVYNRHCASRESADVHIKRIKMMLPPAGQVSILLITDRQYGEIINFYGKRTRPMPNTPRQLELF